MKGGCLTEFVIGKDMFIESYMHRHKCLSSCEIQKLVSPLVACVS